MGGSFQLIYNRFRIIWELPYSIDELIFFLGTERTKTDLRNKIGHVGMLRQPNGSS